MKVLLVDDPTTRRVISMLLNRSDIPCSVVLDGVRAIEEWERGGYELILMDVQMPELDGIEATRRIRARERALGLRRTPIVAMTAHLKPEEKEECLEAGMDELLPKPIEFDKLLALVGKYLGRTI